MSGDADADAIRLRAWQTTINDRLAALEARPVNSPGSSGVEHPAVIVGLSDADRAEINELRAQITDLTAKLAEVEAKTNDTSGVLAGVEAALGSHAHPPLPPAEAQPAEPAKAPEPIVEAQPQPEAAPAG